MFVYFVAIRNVLGLRGKKSGKRGVCVATREDVDGDFDVELIVLSAGIITVYCELL